MGIFAKIILISLPIFIAYYCLCGENFDPSSIRGQRVLVTGASSGIGEQVAYRYCELGARLVMTARRGDLLDKVAERCARLGASGVFPVPADMVSPNDRFRLVQSVERHLGGLDVLILNHAQLHFATWKSSDQDMLLLHRMFNVNFLSYVDVSSRLTEALSKSGGRIGVVSSIAGKIGSIGTAPYGSTKHALHGFFSALRQEFRFRKVNVSVTFMVFGPIDSERAVQIAKDLPFADDFMRLAGSTHEAANVLIKGVAERQYEVYFPHLSTVMVTLYRYFPALVEDFGTSMTPQGADI